MKRYRGSVVFALISFIGVQATAITTSYEFPGSRMGTFKPHYCDFSNLQKAYNIKDLILCMNELASSMVVHSRTIRSAEGIRDFPGISSRRRRPYYQYSSTPHQYPPRPGGDYSSYYHRRPSLYYPGSLNTQSYQSGYYNEGSRYPYSSQSLFNAPGAPGAGLFDALTSISQYDDLKCVPRLLCEVATGVIPGNSNYKQNYDSLGGNSLISLLTGLDIGESSPLLAFGKSALTGYTSRGNPSVCYREYPKCPRNNDELVNYLNNHNGGFFRFFGNVRKPSASSVNYYRGALNREPAPPPGLLGPEADRTGTGELKFDSSDLFTRRDFMKTFLSEGREINDSNKVIFPQEPPHEDLLLNRVSKSFIHNQETEDGNQNTSFFPEERKGRFEPGSSESGNSVSNYFFPKDESEIKSS